MYPKISSKLTYPNTNFMLDNNSVKTYLTTIQ